MLVGDHGGRHEGVLGRGKGSSDSIISENGSVPSRHIKFRHIAFRHIATRLSNISPYNNLPYKNKKQNHVESSSLLVNIYKYYKQL